MRRYIRHICSLLYLNHLVVSAFFSIGFLHSQLNEKDQSVSAYDQTIELMPTFADAYTSRAKYLHRGNL